MFSSQKNRFRELKTYGFKICTILYDTKHDCSLLVDNMVTKGFLERKPNPNDRRAVCIKLTERGLSLFDDVYARFHDELDRRAQSLTAEELNAFSNIVEKISR